MLPQLGSRIHRLLSWLIPVTTLTLTLTLATPAAAQVAPADRLCDNSFEDCRATILQMIRNETAGIDVSYWFMTDWRYSSEIIKRWQAGVPVRILLDLRSDAGYPAGVTLRQSFIDAGIPIRHKFTSGINHWKMMMYRGQNAVHFSAANFSNGSYSPSEAGRRIRQVRGRSDLLHDRSDRRPDVHEEVRRPLDEHVALRQPREHHGTADAKLPDVFGEPAWIPS